MSDFHRQFVKYQCITDKGSYPTLYSLVLLFSYNLTLAVSIPIMFYLFFFRDLTYLISNRFMLTVIVR